MSTKPSQISGFIGLFYLIFGAAERSNFDGLPYDFQFRQSVVVSSGKPWGIPDPSIWLQCMARRSFLLVQHLQPAWTFWKFRGHLLYEL